MEWRNALFSPGVTISPISPDTGLYYFEACLWASGGGLFGPGRFPTRPAPGVGRHHLVGPGRRALPTRSRVDR